MDVSTFYICMFCVRVRCSYRDVFVIAFPAAILYNNGKFILGFELQIGKV